MSQDTPPPPTATQPQPGEPKPAPKVTWEADSSNPEKAEKLRAALAEIVDPELGLNIIQLGLVREVSLQADRAQMRMILTTPFCPYGPMMIDTTREKAELALGLPVHIEIGAEMWSPAMMDQEAAAEWGLFY